MGESNKMKQANEPRREGSKRNGAAEALGSNSEIGRKLKQYYDGLIADDVPDRFTDLLQQLAQQDDAKPSSGKG